MKASEVLKLAQETLKDKGKWCKYALWQEASGGKVARPLPVGRGKRCVMGAITEAPASPEAKVQAMYYLCNALTESEKQRHMGDYLGERGQVNALGRMKLSHWNDDSRTGHRDVMNALSYARMLADMDEGAQ